MNEIKPTYVTFEQAKLFKEKGFDEKCRKCFDTSGKDMSFTDYSLYNELNRNSKVNPIDTNTEEIHLIILCTKPEQWQVVEWLRIKYNIHVTYDVGLTGYYGLIKHRHSNGSLYLSKRVNEQENPFKSSQEAYSAAFDYTLKELI